MVGKRRKARNRREITRLGRETDLTVTPEGWPSIEAALADSRYFVLMASRKAAASPWVAREISYWIDKKGSNTLLIVLTDGDIAWDDAANDFDWARNSSFVVEGVGHSE